MSVLRRAWRILADPPTSEFAILIRNVALPVCLVSVAASLLPGWTGMMLAKPMDLVWLYVLLCVVRQRDQARVEQGAVNE